MNRDALFQGDVLTVSDDLKSDDGVFIVAFAHRLRSHVHISFEVGRGTLEHPLQLRRGLLWIARNGLADRVTRSAAAAQNHYHGHSQSERRDNGDRKSTRLNSSHVAISYAVFCLKKKKKDTKRNKHTNRHTIQHND